MKKKNKGEKNIRGYRVSSVDRSAGQEYGRMGDMPGQLWSGVGPGGRLSIIFNILTFCGGSHEKLARPKNTIKKPNVPADQSQKRHNAWGRKWYTHLVFSRVISSLSACSWPSCCLSAATFNITILSPICSFV